MAEYIACKKGNQYFLENYFTHENLTSVSHEIAKLNHNGYLIISDNIVEPGGFLLTIYESGLEYADNLLHLKHLLEMAEDTLSKYLSVCKDLD